MKKYMSVVLALALVFTLGTISTVSAAEQPTKVLYKLTADKDYPSTKAKLIVFGDIPKDINDLDYLCYGEGDTQEYIEVAKDTKIAGYGVKVEKVDLQQLKKITSDLSAGMYLVGTEITEGTYKLVGDGAVVRLSAVSVDRNLDYIQPSVVVHKGKITYITVKKGDYALQILGNVKATKVK